MQVLNSDTRPCPEFGGDEYTVTIKLEGTQPARLHRAGGPMPAFFEYGTDQFAGHLGIAVDDGYDGPLVITIHGDAVRALGIKSTAQACEWVQQRILNYLPPI